MLIRHSSKKRANRRNAENQGESGEKTQPECFTTKHSGCTLKLFFGFRRPFAFSPQGRTAYAETGGRPADFKPLFFQDAGDCLCLHLVQQRRRRFFPGRGRALRFADVGRFDDRTFRVQIGPFDDIGKFADIARPGMSDQNVQGGG